MLYRSLCVVANCFKAISSCCGVTIVCTHVANSEAHCHCQQAQGGGVVLNVKDHTLVSAFSPFLFNLMKLHTHWAVTCQSKVATHKSIPWVNVHFSLNNAKIKAPAK